MSLKMICIDLDGTLFNGRRINRISKDDRKAVYDAYKRGVKVVVTTGRIFNNAAAVSKKLKLRCPVIAANGSVVGDEELNTLLYKNISIDKCLKICELIEKYNLTAHFYTKDSILPNNLKGFILGKIYSYKNFSISFKVHIKKIYSNNSLRKKIYKYENDIVKCAIYSLNSSDIEKFKEELSEDIGVTVCADGKHSAEVTAYNVTKGEAVKFLSKYLKIDNSEVLCIGDNENDISMVKNCGVFVAMGNAVEILRKSADYITDTNKNCVVAKAIKKFLH